MRPKGRLPHEAPAWLSPSFGFQLQWRLLWEPSALLQLRGPARSRCRSLYLDTDLCVDRGLPASLCAPCASLPPQRLHVVGTQQHLLFRKSEQVEAGHQGRGRKDAERGATETLRGWVWAGLRRGPPRSGLTATEPEWLTLKAPWEAEKIRIWDKPVLFQTQAEKSMSPGLDRNTTRYQNGFMPSFGGPEMRLFGDQFAAESGGPPGFPGSLWMGYGFSFVR